MAESNQFECDDGLQLEYEYELDSDERHLSFQNGMIDNGNCRLQIQSECELEIKLDDFNVEHCPDCNCDQVYP